MIRDHERCLADCSSNNLWSGIQQGRNELCLPSASQVELALDLSAAATDAIADLADGGEEVGGCCLGDLNGDGAVNGAGQGALSASWGTPCVGCPAHLCGGADFNGDGNVNGADLGVIFPRWGSYPGTPLLARTEKLGLMTRYMGASGIEELAIALNGLPRAQAYAFVEYFLMR